MKRTGTDISPPSRLRRLLHKPLAFMVRDFKVAASYRLRFLLTGAGVFFSAAVFYMVTRVIGLHDLAFLEPYGGDYFSFLIIGVAFTDYLAISTDSFAADVREAQVLGTLEALLVSPTSIFTILFSSYAFTVAASSLRLLVYLGAGLLVFGLKVGPVDPAALLAAALLTLLPFIGIGLISGSFIIVFKQGSPISMLVSVSSSLLGGVIYPVAVLPDWLQAVSRALPITYGLETLRQVLLNGAGLAQVAGDLWVLAGFSLVLPALGIWSTRAAVRLARREGTLLHY